VKKIEVVAAIIVYDSKILCLQRGPSKYDYISKKFEFPGGKVESGESNEMAIKREIKEELGIDIEVQKAYLTIEHQYPDFFLTMHSFICATNSKEISLNEHIDLKWLSVDEFNQLDWAAADLPIVFKLVNEANV
jgi:8-oxo-dGTP diphosphatase